MQSVPELLAPAGSLEKLKLAVLYGANAVYLGGQKFGLRTAADNFTLTEIEEAVNFSHQRGVKVYVVLNSFFHNSDFDDVDVFLSFLQDLKVDAVIVSDLGLVKHISKNYEIDIHLSTQASCLNVHAAKFWKKMGVSRIVLGREVTLEQAKHIKNEAGIEVEMFIHGSMCMAYSGNCVISNYTSGRDSNRGGCAHSCRFEYTLEDQNKKVSAYFMSSKDLNGISLLKEYADCGIDSVKVEGRMKGHLYLGTLTKVYSEALSELSLNGSISSESMKKYLKELNKVTHRDYTLGSLVDKAGADSVYSEREHEIKEYLSLGSVVDVVKDEFLVLEVRNSFVVGQEIEIIPFNESEIVFNLSFVRDLEGNDIQRTKPGTLVKIPFHQDVSSYNIVRSKISFLETGVNQ